MHKMKYSFLLLVGCLLSFPAAAKLYKWVDAQGATHYGEVIPPEYADNNRSELSPTGREINKSEKMTPEQKKAKDQEIKEQNAKQAEALEQKRRDKALLNTFSNVEEIEASKQRNVQQVEGVLRSSVIRLGITQKKMQDLQTEAENIKKTGRKMPFSLREELKSTQLNLEKQQKDIERLKVEKSALEARFEADKARYRLLTGAQ